MRVTALSIALLGCTIPLLTMATAAVAAECLPEEYTYSPESARSGQVCGILFPVCMTTTSGFSSTTWGLAEVSDASGCGDSRSVAAMEFIRENHDAILADAARGHGEHLASIGALLGVPVYRQAAFAHRAQTRLAALMSNGRPEPAQLHDGLLGLSGARAVGETLAGY